MTQKGILLRHLLVGLITGRVFARQVYMRLTLTVGACYLVIIQWGFPRIIIYYSYSLRI